MPSKEKKLKQIAKVENMLSNRSHKPVANQFKITMQNGLEVFQSYETIICIKDPRNNEILFKRNIRTYQMALCWVCLCLCNGFLSWIRYKLF